MSRARGSTPGNGCSSSGAGRRVRGGGRSPPGGPADRPGLVPPGPALGAHPLHRGGQGQVPPTLRGPPPGRRDHRRRRGHRAGRPHVRGLPRLPHGHDQAGGPGVRCGRGGGRHRVHRSPRRPPAARGGHLPPGATAGADPVLGEPLGPGDSPRRVRDAGLRRPQEVRDPQQLGGRARVPVQRAGPRAAPGPDPLRAPAGAGGASARGGRALPAGGGHPGPGAVEPAVLSGPGDLVRPGRRDPGRGDPPPAARGRLRRPGGRGAGRGDGRSGGHPPGRVRAAGGGGWRSTCFPPIRSWTSGRRSTGRPSAPCSPGCSTEEEDGDGGGAVRRGASADLRGDRDHRGGGDLRRPAEGRPRDPPVPPGPGVPDRPGEPPGPRDPGGARAAVPGRSGCDRRRGRRVPPAGRGTGDRPPGGGPGREGPVVPARHRLGGGRADRTGGRLVVVTDRCMGGTHGELGLGPGPWRGV